MPRLPGGSKNIPYRNGLPAVPQRIPDIHRLNSGTLALLMTTFSGTSTERFTESRLPNHTEISAIASREMTNCRLARKNPPRATAP